MVSYIIISLYNLYIILLIIRHVQLEHVLNNSYKYLVRFDLVNCILWVANQLIATD